MAGLNETPNGNRVHIAFFGLRNAGKSTLVNAFCGQDVAIVSDVPGTTTDPVSKAMEILPLGPCLITDTAGLDDEGALGAERVKRTLGVLATTDIAVWVEGEGIGNREQGIGKEKQRLLEECQKRGVMVMEYRRGESVEELKRKVAAARSTDELPGLLDGMVVKGDRVVCVCPIDESAPKGRLILPQVQVIRACLDMHVACSVVQVDELRQELDRLVGTGNILIVIDSQVFGEVNDVVSGFDSRSSSLKLTSFSILFARQKGDVDVFKGGLEAIAKLKDGDTVLIAEGCTHHRQCNDIGSVKIPKAVEALSGKKLNFAFASGNTFKWDDAARRPSLVVHCGGCMLTRREMLRRIGLARDAGIPIVNYGMLLSAAAQRASRRHPSRYRCAINLNEAVAKPCGRGVSPRRTEENSSSS